MGNTKRSLVPRDDRKKGDDAVASGRDDKQLWRSTMGNTKRSLVPRDDRKVGDDKGRPGKRGPTCMTKTGMIRRENTLAKSSLSLNQLPCVLAVHFLQHTITQSKPMQGPVVIE